MIHSPFRIDLKNGLTFNWKFFFYFFSSFPSTTRLIHYVRLCLRPFFRDFFIHFFGIDPIYTAWCRFYIGHITFHIEKD